MCPSASVERLVTCLGLAPSGSISQICDDPPRSEIYAMRFESGDQRGRELASPSCVICRGAPPPSRGVTQTCVGFLFEVTSTVCTVKATQRLSGEIWGSLMRLSESSAFTSKGF